MADEVTTEKPSEMLAEIKRHQEDVRSQMRGTKKESLPEGAAPIEAKAEAETPVEAATETTKPIEQKEEPIMINGREFSSTKEAVKYAEQLEQEKLISEARNMGVQDALSYVQAQVPKAPVEEEDFDTKFYSNPKETLRNVKEEAKNEVMAQIRAEQQKENLWSQFLTENPGLRRKDAERVLQENWETLGKMTDIPKAMKILAQKVRADYDEIAFLAKPRTELPARSGQAVSTGGGAPQSVTHTKKDEAPLTMSQQMRQLRGH